MTPSNKFLSFTVGRIHSNCIRGRLPHLSSSFVPNFYVWWISSQSNQILWNDGAFPKWFNFSSKTAKMETCHFSNRSIKTCKYKRSSKKNYLTKKNRIKNRYPPKSIGFMNIVFTGSANSLHTYYTHTKCNGNRAGLISYNFTTM